MEGNKGETSAIGNNSTIVKLNTISAEQWNQEWIDGCTNWHLCDVNPHLLEFHKYLDLKEDGLNQRVFIPLCGKSLDIAWLYQKYKEVEIVGVELSAIACDAFFDENNIKKEEPKYVKGDDGAKVVKYQSGDGRITLFCGNLFLLGKEELGEFDVIWDRGSLVAIDESDHKQYSKLMLSLMKQSCKYLLECFDYDPTIYGGPPHTVPLQVLGDLYAAACTITLLKELIFRDPVFETWGFTDGCPMKVYLIEKH